MVELGDQRVLAPGPWRWARSIGWMVGLFVTLTAVFVLLGNPLIRGLAALDGTPATELKFEPGWLKFAGMAIVLGFVVGVYWFAVRWGENRRPTELALRQMLPEWLLGMAVGFGLMGATIGILGLTGVVTVEPTPARAIWQALINTLQSGVAEEVLFRLVLFRLLWRAFGVWWALSLSALIFGGLHLSEPNASLFAALCIALEAGILLAAFYVLTGRIWTSIGVHMGWNFAQGWLFGAPVSGSQGFDGGPLITEPRTGLSDILHGGGFGPEASLPALVICTAVGMFVLHRARAHLKSGSPSNDTSNPLTA